MATPPANWGTLGSWTKPATPKTSGVDKQLVNKEKTHHSPDKAVNKPRTQRIPTKKLY